MLPGDIKFRNEGGPDRFAMVWNFIMKQPRGVEVPRSKEHPRLRLKFISLSFFVAGIASRVVVNVAVGNVAVSYPIEIFVQFFAYAAGLLSWVA